MTSDSTSGAAKASVLARIARERSLWEDLLAKVDPASDEEPRAIGEWSFKEVVAHLAGWRQRFVDELAAAVPGTPAPPQPRPFAIAWTGEGTSEGEAKVQAINV